MNKRIVIIGVTVAMTIAGHAFAGDDEKRVLIPGKWYPKAEAGFTLSQSAFSNNWSGGDKGSVVWTAIFNSNLENQIHQKVNWYSSLKLAFGQTHQQKADAGGGRYWEKPAKSTDLIDLETILRFTLGAWVDPFASGRIESQFQDASDPMGRTLSLNPVQVKISAGMARKFIDREDESFLARLGFMLRESRRKLFANDAPDKSTVSESSTDGGIEFSTDHKRKILDGKVAWTSKFTAYKVMFYSGSDEFDDIHPEDLESMGLHPNVGDYPKTVDLDWENIFSTQITKLLSVNLYTRWVYDKYDNSVVPMLDASSGDLTNAAAIRGAIRKAGQFKQTMAIGVVYRFL